jgi:hypothetical protein
MLAGILYAVLWGPFPFVLTYPIMQGLLLEAIVFQLSK